VKKAAPKKAPAIEAKKTAQEKATPVSAEAAPF